MSRVLVAEKLSELGVAILRDAGHTVDVQLGLDDAALRVAIAEADALIVRSATQVTAELLAHGKNLRVIGRAGVGLDNIDTIAATDQGVIVANAPTSNSISAAEHTMALLLALARNVPQANAALTHGRWERANWKGVELHDKTLGIIGLGRIGGLVANRAHSFGMNLIGHDPFISEERASELSVLLVDLDAVIARSDFLTLHVARTPETTNMINLDRLKLAKPNLRIINVARGGIINETDLTTALQCGLIAGAALDVFDSEPKTDSPLFELPNVVVTPHLGASTDEAQDRAGVSIAEQVNHALAGEFVPFAVNVDAKEVADVLRPFLSLSEQLGARFVRLVGGQPGSIDITFAGEIGGFDCRLAELAAIKGALSELVDLPVSYVNAEKIAQQLGIKIRATSTTSTSSPFVNTIALDGDGHALAGTVLDSTGEHRITAVDNISVDITPADHLLVLANDDTPGMIGIVGTMMGDAGINIDDMHIGRASGGGVAVMVIATAQPIPVELTTRLAATSGIVSVKSLDLPA